MKNLIIIDGNSLLFRAYYATAYPGANIMRTKEGTPTNAIFAFSNMINKIISNLKEGDSLFVAFDTGKKTFRHEELETYKANRKKAPEDLIVQMPLAREFLKSLGVFIFEMDGFEGDDVAGTVAKIASKEDYHVNLYTSDRDFLQLIDDNILINIIKKGMSDIIIMDEEKVIDEYGFKPLQIVDYKGLRGDSSDNLPGIPGIGDKGASKLIATYGSFENIVEKAKAGEIKGKVSQSIIENEALGALCKHLAIIKSDLDLPFSISETLYEGYDFEEISRFCQKLELKSFLNKLPHKWQRQNTIEEEIKIEEISSIEGILVEDDFSFALDMEEGNYHKEEIYGISLYLSNRNYYLSVENLITDKKLKEILENPNIKKYCYDYKSQKCALSRLSINLEGNGFDLLLASYLLDSSLSSKQDNVFSSFGISLKNSDEQIDLFAKGDKLRSSKISRYVFKLKNRVIKELEKVQAKKLYEEIELPLADILAKMEIEGFPLDRDTLLNIGDEFKKKVASISEEIYLLTGEKFNLQSPKQIGEVLFDKLGIKNPKKYSTSNDVLVALFEEHPIIPLLIDYRKYAKLVSTYIDGLVQHIYKDGKIHAMFNQALTTTGRLSSSEPNLQNISIRDEEGKLIRKAFFYPNDEYDILSLDYSQIELRILASLSKCPGLIEVFKDNQDIHTATAKKVFHVDEVSELERRKAKAVNFGIVYGISDWGLSEQLGISVKEAKNIISSFYDAYPEVAVFLRNIVVNAEKNGYVETLFGRRRYLREIHDSNYQTREFAKRAAMNAPIQGTAADLIKLAMIKVDQLISEGKYKTKLVLQIHDELLFKVPKSERDVIYKLIKSAMENVIELDVPLLTDGEIAKTWYEAK